GRLGRREQAIGRASADGLRLARGLYGRGVEAERRPSVGDRAGALLPVEQQPVHLGHRGKVLASAAGRVREGEVAAIAQKRPTAIFFNGLLNRHTALFFNGRDDVRRDIGSKRIVVSWKLGHAAPPSTACIDLALARR